MVTEQRVLDVTVDGFGKMGEEKRKAVGFNVIFAGIVGIDLVDQ